MMFGALPRATRRTPSLVEVRASRIHGRGVYATRAIRKSKRIIEYTGARVSWESIPDDSDDPRTFFFGLHNGKDVIDPAIGGNEACWINHSCAPNCQAIEDESERIFIYALRNIRAGEELTYDYSLEIDEPRSKESEIEALCCCQSRHCRGTMLQAA